MVMFFTCRDDDFLTKTRSHETFRQLGFLLLGAERVVKFAMCLSTIESLHVCDSVVPGQFQNQQTSCKIATQWIVTNLDSSIDIVCAFEQ